MARTRSGKETSNTTNLTKLDTKSRKSITKTKAKSKAKQVVESVSAVEKEVGKSGRGQPPKSKSVTISVPPSSPRKVKVEAQQVKKVVRLNENPMEIKEEVIDVGDQSIDNEPSDMDKLPPEILMKILSYFNEQQLVKCRLLSSRWNEISCLLLQQTTNNLNSGLIVEIKKNMECTIVITKSLDAFLDCFSPSEAEKSSGHRRPFPFSGFKIQSLKHMNLTQMCEFVSSFGPNMKTVSVEINKKDIPNFEGFLRLLLHFAPNVQHLKITGDSSLENIKLVDPIYRFIAKADPLIKLPNDKFLNLKVLTIMPQYVVQFNGFMTDLLDSAPNIQEVSGEEFNWNYANDLNLIHLEDWQQLGKDHLLKSLGIYWDFKGDFAPAVLMKNLQLKKLYGDCNVPSDLEENEKAMINYIYHAIKSSQGTLTLLNLSSLSMKSMNFCFKGISSLPNVRQLYISIEVSMETGNILDRFSQLFPNVTCLALRSMRLSFSNVARILWTGFKGLKSLSLNLTIDNGDCHPSILDSALTGYSLESIERIESKLQEGISIEEARGGELQNSSILELKHLVKLHLSFNLEEAESSKLQKQVENSLFLKIIPEYLYCNSPGLLEFSIWDETIDSDDDDEEDSSSGSEN